MASALKQLVVTPGLLDLGNRIVRLDHVVSVSLGERRPLRLVGLALVLIAAGLGGYEWYYSTGTLSLAGLASLKAIPAPRIWAACGAAGLGLFGLIHGQRCLFVTTADGTRLALRHSDAGFGQALLGVLRDAMAGPPGQRLRIVADLKSEQLHAEPLGEGDAMYTQSHPPAGPDPGRGAQPLPRRDSRPGPAHAQPAALPRLEQPPLGPGLNGAAPHGPPVPGSNHNGPHLNGAMPHGVHLNGAAPNGAPRHAAPLADPRRPQPANGLAPGTAIPALATLAPPTPRLTPLTDHRDLIQLIDFVGRAPIQHREALIDLLRVVENHAVGGPTSREDALAHWRSFADYVARYLTAVDGLPVLTSRVERVLARAD